VLRDETLCEIAAHAPSDVEHLARCRGLSRSIAENRQGAQILAAVKRGLELPASECPEPTPRRDLPSGIGPLIELLRVLLKMRCEDHDVAQKLIASADDLELIAADDGAAVPALHGWRREIFGADALALKHGRLALTVVGRRVKVVPSPRPEPRTLIPLPCFETGEGDPSRSDGGVRALQSRSPSDPHPPAFAALRQAPSPASKRGRGNCYRGPRAFALAVATERPSARPSASRRRSTASPYMTPPFFGSTTVRRSPARRRLVSRNSRWVAPDRE